MKRGDGYVVVVTLQPRPMPSLRLEKRYTRIDYSSTCIMRDILDSMSRMLTVNSVDLTLEDEDGKCFCLEQTLADYYGQRPVRRQRKEINLNIRHTPSAGRQVTCTVGKEEDPDAIHQTTPARHTTVQLPNTATFGELLERARTQRGGSAGVKDPVYGHPGELDISLRDAWVRDGCKVDYTFHVGRAVVVHCPDTGSDADALSFVLGPGDTIGDIKKRIYEENGVDMSLQSVMIHGAAQGLENRVALGDCCIANSTAGSFTARGSDEIHFELRVQEPAFAGNYVQGSDGSRASEAMPKPRKFFALKERGIDANNQLTRPSAVVDSVFAWSPNHCPPSPTGSDICDGPPKYFDEAAAKARTPEITLGRRPTISGSRTVVIFALSPSGRALTLTLRQDAQVADAKELIAFDEGVPPYLQRLLWRGSALEPDTANLHALGIRSGDTLILGYRIPPSIPTIGSAITRPSDNQESATSLKDAVGDGVYEEKATTIELALNEESLSQKTDTITAETGSSNGAASANVANTNAAPGVQAESHDVVRGGEAGILPENDTRRKERRNTVRGATRRAWPFSKTKARGISTLGDQDRSGSRSGPPPSPASISPSRPAHANFRRVSPALVAVPVALGTRTTSSRAVGSRAIAGVGRSSSLPSGGRVNVSGWQRWKHVGRASTPSTGSSRGV